MDDFDKLMEDYGIEVGIIALGVVVVCFGVRFCFCCKKS